MGFILKLVLGGLLLVVVLVAFYFLKVQKMLAPFEVSQFTIEPATFIYCQYRGDYQQVMGTVQALKADINDYLGEQRANGKVCEKGKAEDMTLCGVYYDSPHSIVDPKMARACLGVLIRDEDNVDFTSFAKGKLEKRLKYSQVKLGRLQAIGASFPLLGLPSLMSAIIRGYPVIFKQASEKGLLDRLICSMEMYEWSRQSLGICFGYGKNAEALVGLSGFPQPQVKDNVPVRHIKKHQ